MMQSMAGMMSIAAITASGLVVGMVGLAKLPVMIIGVLKSVGNAISGIFSTGQSLLSSFANTVETTSEAVKNFNKTVSLIPQTTGMLITGGQATIDVFAGITRTLVNAGTSITDVLKTMSDVGRGFAGTGATLINLGASMTDVISGMVKVNASVIDMASVFSSAGASAGKIVATFSDINAAAGKMVVTASTVGQVFFALGADIYQIASMMKTFGATTAEITSSLAKMGFGSAEIGVTLAKLTGSATETAAAMGLMAAKTAAVTAEFAAESTAAAANHTAQVAMTTAAMASEIAMEKTKATMAVVSSVIKGLAGLGAALLPFIATGIMLYATWGLLKAVFWTVVEAVKALAVALFEFGKSIASALGTALLGTLNAIGRAFGRLAGAAVGFFQKHKAAFVGLKESLFEVYEQMKTTFGYVVQALKNGDVQSAMELIKWEAFRQLINLEQFVRALLWNMLSETPKAVAVLGEIFSEMFAGIGEVLMDLWKTIKQEFEILKTQVVNSIFVIHEQGSPDVKRQRVQHERAVAAIEKTEPERLNQFHAGRLKFNDVLQDSLQNSPEYQKKIKELRLAETKANTLAFGFVTPEIHRIRDELKNLENEEREKIKQVAYADNRNPINLDVQYYLDVMEGRAANVNLQDMLVPASEMFNALFEQVREAGDVKGAEVMKNVVAPQIWNDKTQEEQLAVLKKLAIEAKEWKDMNPDERSKITEEILGKTFQEMKETLAKIIEEKYGQVPTQPVQQDQSLGKKTVAQVEAEKELGKLQKVQCGVSTLLHLIFSLFFRAPIGIRGAYRLG
jgi:hypothetical protein